MQRTGRKGIKFGETHRRCFSLFILALLMFTGTSEAFEASLSPHFNGGDGTYTDATRDGQPVWIPDSYLYFSVPGFPASVQSAYVEITYYDDLVGPWLRLEYDSVSASYTLTGFHTRSSGEGSMAFVKSYQRLDDPLFANRENGGADFRFLSPAFPIKSVIVRDTPFSDPYAAYALSHNPPWLSPYLGPSNDYVNAETIKGKVVVGYQGWFKAPNDLYDGSWVHWGFDGIGNSTVDMWPDPLDYEMDSLTAVPGFITESGEQGYVFSSGDPLVVQKHFEWMRQYNIDGVYLQRFFVNSTAGAKPEWVLAHVREAAHLEGRVWAIEYDISSANDGNLYNTITADWIWLVDQVGITSDSRYLHEQGKPVVVVWGAGIRTNISQGPLNDLVDFLKDDPVYGGNYVVGCVKNTFPSAWDSHFARYDSIFAWMGSQTNVATHAAQYGINAQVHVWPGFSWHNLQEFVFPYQYTDREGGEFFWEKISNGIDIIDPEAIFVGMFDEYDESTAVMPMSDDPPVVPYPNIPNIDSEDDWGYYITNDGSPRDWWMMLSGYAKETLCNQVPFSFTIPMESLLANRSNIGEELTVDLGTTNYSDLLYQVENLGNGVTDGDIIAGVTCRRATNNYIYFDVDNTILHQVSAGANVTIVVDYYDTNDEVDISLQYDSVSDEWKVHPKLFVTSGSERWQTVRFEINDAYFGDRENGSDFRLRSLDAARNMNIARVRIILPKSSVPVCGGSADFNCNGTIGLDDFSYMAGVWLTADPTGDIAQPADGLVDLLDLLVLAHQWLNDSLIEGAIGYWRLDETAGSVARDASVHAYHGTLVNMDDPNCWVAGKMGNALSFDGLDDYVAFDSVFTGMTGRNLTVSAWVKVPAVNTAHQFMVSINTSNGTNNKIMLGTQANSDTLSMYESGWRDTATTVIDDAWHHVAYALEDSSDTITVYVDGSEVLSFTSTVSVAASDVFSLGQEYDAGMTTGDFYSGLLDDVRIYDRALSEAEIARLAQ